MNKWDLRFFELAKLYASWSKDATKVGAVISRYKHTLSHGYNGFPEGIEETETRLQRPAKYYWTEHAERNALYFANELGISLGGSTLYTTLFPCADCMRGIIRCGIVRIVSPEPPAPIGVAGDWRESCAAAFEMMTERGLIFAPVAKEYL